MTWDLFDFDRNGLGLGGVDLYDLSLRGLGLGDLGRGSLDLCIGSRGLEGLDFQGLGCVCALALFALALVGFVTLTLSALAMAMEVVAVVALVCPGGLVCLGLGCLGLGGHKKRDFRAEHS